MNKVLLALNIVLLIAVGTLYYLYFKYKDADKHAITLAEKSATNFKIAYFDLDSLQNNYDYYKQVRDYLKGRDAQMKDQLTRLKNNYIAKLKEYNQKGATMSQTEQSEYQQQLAKMESDYRQTEQDLMQQGQEEYMRRLQEVKTQIQSFLKDYCRQKGYAYVLGSEENDYLYYKDTLRNITPEIITLLNDAYKKTKKP